MLRLRAIPAATAVFTIVSCVTAPATHDTVPAAQPMASTATAPAIDAAADEGARLHQLLDEEWEYALREFPTLATYVGDPRYADVLVDISPEAIARREEHERALLERVRQIDRSRLSAADQLNYDLFLRDVEESIQGQQFPGELIQIHQMGGVHQDIADLAQATPRRTVADYENFIKRLRALPVLVDQTIHHMRRGVEQGITPPRITLREVGNQIRAQVVGDPAKSPIYEVMFKEFPQSIPAAEQERLRAAGQQAIREVVIPAYKKLHQFWTSEYYPRTRESIGISELPNGRAWYAYNVRRMTTTEMTPDQIHQLGLSEVQRIRGEMEKIRHQVGFKGTLQQFFNHLRTDPKFFHTTEEALLVEYRDISKRIDPELTRLFGTLPRLPYGVIPVPDYSEKTQTTAYYSAGSLEAGRPGYFYANTYDLKSRPKWEMEALTLHEAVPGHHLQIAIAQELGEVPKFRRFGGYTAFVEGWGLYAESLGPELGMYKDPYSKFGQLTYEMWRAIRLVVDTGMHSKGWTRQQAIDFFKENAGKTEHDITVEIDRYIVWPGQALAYKIGELKIKELRAMATRDLGDRFDVRSFHDTVLGAGALPLSLLEQRVRDWVQQRKTAS